MDALVAKYRRPAGMMEESFGEEEAQDMMALENPGLSLKFAMPPVSHVSARPIRSYALPSPPHSPPGTKRGITKVLANPSGL